MTKRVTLAEIDAEHRLSQERVAALERGEKLPYSLAQKVARHRPPITPEVVLKLYLQVYEEWKAKKK